MYKMVSLKASELLSVAFKDNHLLVCLEIVALTWSLTFHVLAWLPFTVAGHSRRPGFALF
jgi:hypothetical protein